MKFTNKSKLNPNFFLIALLIISILFSLLFVVIRIVPSTSPTGDEGFFIKEFERFENTGIYSSFSQGISHLYVLTVYFINLFISDYLISGRVLSLVSGIIIIFFVYQIAILLDLRKPYKLLLILNVLTILLYSRSGYLMSINDPLMVACATTVVYFLILYMQKKRTKHLIITSILMGFLFWIRYFSILIVPGVIISIIAFEFFAMKRFWKKLSRLALFLFTMTVIALTPQIPSIIENKTLSFEKKNYERWEKRNWLDHINRIDCGSFFCYDRTPWEAVDEYISENGEKSIPGSLLDRLKMDRKFFFDNIVSNLFIRIPYLFLLNFGLLFFLLFDFFRIPEKWLKSNFFPKLSLSLISISTILFLSIVIITYIEMRWVVLTIILCALLTYERLQAMELYSLKRFLFTIQIVFLIVMNSINILRIIAFI